MRAGGFPKTEVTEVVVAVSKVNVEGVVLVTGLAGGRFATASPKVGCGRGIWNDETGSVSLEKTTTDVVATGAVLVAVAGLKPPKIDMGIVVAA